MTLSIPLQELQLPHTLYPVRKKLKTTHEPSSRKAVSSAEGLIALERLQKTLKPSTLCSKRIKVKSTSKVQKNALRTSELFFAINNRDIISLKSEWRKITYFNRDKALNQKVHQGISPIMLCTIQNFLKGFYFFFSFENVDLLVVNENRENLLTIATRLGHIEIAHALLSSPKIDINWTHPLKRFPKRLYTTLKVAIYCKQDKMALFLLKQPGIQFDRPNRLFDLVVNKCIYTFIQILSDPILQAKFKITKEELEATLFFSVQANAESFVKEALKMGVNPNSSTSGRSPLVQAAYLENRKIVHMLLEYGAENIHGIQWLSSMLPSPEKEGVFPIASMP